jgi:hypothetical protein
MYPCCDREGHGTEPVASADVLPPHPGPLPLEGEGVVSIPSPPEGERVRVRGRCGAAGGARNWPVVTTEEPK